MNEVNQKCEMCLICVFLRDENNYENGNGHQLSFEMLYILCTVWCLVWNGIKKIVKSM